MKRPQIEMIDVPPKVVAIVEARMAPFIASEFRGSSGVLDLRRLTMSAYLQGFCDAADAIENSQPWIGIA